MRFKDAREAGRSLAERLGARVGGEAVVVAVARGGVGVGLEVARRLGLPFDLLLLQRLLLPHGPLLPACAANVAGTAFLDEGIVEALAAGAHDPALRDFLAAAVAELDADALECRGGRPALDLAGRNVILVDNGIRTGSTMLTALRALRSVAPARVVAAAPVAAPESLAAVESAADDFVYLHTPDPFGHVGLWYTAFTRPSCDEIRAMLEEVSPTPSL